MNDKLKILIAEDNEVTRKMIAALLEKKNYEPIHAEHGDEAIEKIGNSGHISLCLVDINMAPKGGFEFVKYMRLRNIQLPVVIITADNSSDILVEANKLDIKSVLQKPIDPERLYKTVERFKEDKPRSDPFKL